jgi:threonine-phosphate decarboxylase
MYKHGGDIYNNENITDFSTNTNLLGIPEGVINEACRGVKLSSHYPDTNCQALRQAISEVELISADHIICGNGAAELIFSLVFSLKPKKALLVTPSFYEYENALSAVDCEIEYYELKEENRIELTEDFLSHLNASIDIIFLCNPNNPTGALIPLNFMEKILEQCEKYHILLVVDECFMDFVKNKRIFSIKHRSLTSKNLFILKAFTKLYAMPGLRLGYGLCCNEKLLDRMKQITQPWNISIPAQLAGIAALKEEEYVTKSLEILEEERHFWKCELLKLGVKVYASEANYMFFSILYKQSKDKLNLYQECLNRSFLIRDCSNYKGLKQGYYRIAVKTREENRKLLAVLQEVL